MRIGNAIKRYGMTVAGGAMGLVHGAGKVACDTPKIGANVAKGCASEVKDVWQSDSSFLSKTGKSVGVGATSLALTALGVTSNLINTMTFGLASGMEAGFAMAEKGGKVQFSKDKTVTQSPDGFQTSLVLPRDDLGIALMPKSEEKRTPVKFLQNDTVGGAKVQIHGEKSGNGPLLMF